MNYSNLKSGLTILVKLLLTTGLLYYVATLVKYEEIKPLVIELDISVLAVAIFAHIIAFILMSIRWWLILESSGKRPRYNEVLPAYYLGLFCNNFLPTAMGGDVIRVIKLRSNGFNVNQLIFSTLADRIIGLLSILALGIIGLNLSVSVQTSVGENLLFLLNVSSGILLIFCIAMLHPGIRQKIAAFILDKAKLWRKARNFLAYAHENIEALISGRILPISILLSIFSQLLIVVTYYYIAKSLHLHIDLLEFILAVPVVALFSSLPISVGGMGIREGTMVFLLGAAGVPTTSAVSISLLYLSILIFVTLPGGFFLLSMKRDASNMLAAHNK